MSQFSSIGPVPQFVIMTASEKMPNNCWGNYAKVAIVETDGVTMPSRIDYRFNCIRSIPFMARRLNCGHTDRCAFRRALKQANEKLADLRETVASECTDRMVDQYREETSDAFDGMMSV